MGPPVCCHTWSGLFYSLAMKSSMTPVISTLRPRACPSGRLIPSLLALFPAGVLLLAPAPADAHNHMDPGLECRAAISKSVGKLAKAVGKTVTGCNKNRLKGTVDAGNDCSDLDAPGTDPKGKLTKSESKFVDAIAGSRSRCAGQIPGMLGYSTCPAPCDATVPVISTMTDLANCLVCTTESDETAMFTASLGAPTPPLPKADAKCHSTIAKEQSKFFGTVLKERSKCQATAEHDGATDLTGCADLDPTGKIASARIKAQDKVSKSCGAANLVSVDSCATTSVGDLNTCLFDEADVSAEAVFQSAYQSSAPTWAGVQAVFVQVGNCASALCHGNVPGAAGLGDIDDFDVGYDELLIEGVTCATSLYTNRVVANDTANSFLIAKLQGTQDCGNRMPPGGLMAQEYVDYVISWVANGAVKE